jgi:hypothetical protein
LEVKVFGVNAIVDGLLQQNNAPHLGRVRISELEEDDPFADIFEP